jgi:hypothetical protein
MNPLDDEEADDEEAAVAAVPAAAPPNPEPDEPVGAAELDVPVMIEVLPELTDCPTCPAIAVIVPLAGAVSVVPSKLC